MADDCQHEMHLGHCLGCGLADDRTLDDVDTPSARPGSAGCEGRGWYHDGSEQEDATRTGRIARPCPQTHTTRGATRG